VYLLVAAATPAAAQQTMDVGSIGGRVADGSGAVVAGARVEARQVATNLTTATTSDGEGRYRFASLRVGRYELVVSRPGFARVVRELTLAAGSAFEVPIVLQPEGVDTRVTVRAEIPLVETGRTQLATTLAEHEVRQVPLNGRHFLDLALLAPTVAPPNINSTQLFAETSAVPGVGLSIGGHRNFSNSVLVDGLSANDEAAGLSGLPYGVDAVEELQVVTSGGQAELGRALAGYVNIVTRSGGNQRRGTAYVFVRDHRFNAANALSGTRLPMSQQQLGASLGGPLARDRSFYFVNAERRALDQTGLTTIAEADVARINARLTAVGYPGAPVATGRYAAPVDAVQALAKIDHAASPRTRLGVRYSLYDVAATHARGAGGLSAPSASQGLDNRDHAIAATLTRMLGERTVHETRAQVTDSDLRARATDPLGPAVGIAGVASFGTLASSPQARADRMVEVLSSVAQQRGVHALRAGVDVLHNADRIDFPRAVRGAYAFSSMASFLAGTYNTAGFTQTFGETGIAQRSTSLGLFIQDAWTASSSLTLNLGLRHDLQWLETIGTDANDLAPRLGFAWTPSASRRLVVRGSAGVFYDRVPLRALANALLSSGNTTELANLRQTSISLSPGQSGAPVFPAVLAAPVPSVTLVNLTTMQRDLQHASSRQASLEVEQQVGRLGTVSVSYTYSRGRDLLMAINQNVPSCVAAGTNNGCRPNPQYANDSRYSSAGRSRYHALVLSVTQRPTGWGYYRASYTLARAMNDVGEFFFSGPIDPFDLSKDWSRADNDRRHLFVFTGAVNTPMAPARTAWQAIAHGFQASALLQAYSAAPFNITSGVTTVQGTAGRPLVNGAFIPRNAGVGDAFFSLGLRVSRSFALGGPLRLEAVGEVFNLTNAVNETARNTTFGTGAYPDGPAASFDRVTAVGEPRSAQFALRLRF
jgi:hypothetical protein